jgi:UDP-N-acetylmuramyl pentapeptide synthase
MTHTLEQLELVTGGRLVLGAGCQAQQPIAGLVSLVGGACEPNSILWKLDAGADLAVERQAWGRRCGLVTETSPRYVPEKCWALVVEDARRALYAWTRHVRDLRTAPVVALVGDGRPTALAGMLEAVLRTGAAELADAPVDADLNLCLRLTGDAEPGAAAMVVLPADQHSSLAALAQPDIAICLCDDAKQVSGAARLNHWNAALASLPQHTLTILSGDNPLARRAASDHALETRFVGRSGDCDYVAERVVCQGGKLTFRVAGQDFELSTWGRHRLLPALAAIAVGRELGQPLAEIAHRLRSWADPMMPAEAERSGVRTIGPVPTSEYRAGLAMLREMPALGRRVVICGLNDQDTAPRGRRWLGQLAVLDCGPDLLLAFGEHGSEVAHGARRAGLPADRTVVCASLAEARRYAAQAFRPGDTVLLHDPEHAWCEADNGEFTLRRVA